MQLSSFLLLSLLQGALAYSDFYVHQLRAVDNDGNRQRAISFDFEDVNTGLTKPCSARFPQTSNGGILIEDGSYLACSNDATFSWKFGAFRGVDDFELDLRRSFRDPAVGSPPQDIVTLFGYHNITVGPEYQCRRTQRGQDCYSPGNSKIFVPVTGAIAK